MLEAQHEDSTVAIKGSNKLCVKKLNFWQVAQTCCVMCKLLFLYEQTLYTEIPLTV